ncbi:tripartite tricarboxylate transporter TctB family protein [Bosea sp. TAF32]|uniref:tripartite tricarboxylate transporter TctB family protein n=1 Tax=Bosea sp. TAF32 TaxID=3237482 RepID=UPI003F8EFB94
MRLHLNQEVLAGLIFASLGGLGLWLGSNYPVGSALRMGPGYLPTLLCWLLVGLGATIAIRGVAIGGEPITYFNIRSLILIVAGVLAFAALVDRLGLAIGTIAVIMIGALAGHEFKFREMAALSIGLAIAASVLFVFVLGLPIKILAGWR